MLISCLAYSSALKMEVTCSSETPVDFQWTTQLEIFKRDFDLKITSYDILESKNMKIAAL
jgi:hypothetical protein